MAPIKGVVVLLGVVVGAFRVPVPRVSWHGKSPAAAPATTAAQQQTQYEEPVAMREYSIKRWWRLPSPVEVGKKVWQMRRRGLAVCAGLTTAQLTAMKACWASGGGGGGLLSPGPMRDALILLAFAALVAPTLKTWGLSPILGFLSVGALLGPDGFGVVSQVQSERALAEVGVTIFLFEMGLGLSLERLKTMRREIFGLGVAQYAATTAVLAFLATFAGGLMGATLAERLVVGGALALSSSAFALQLLRDKDELACSHGRSALGVLLLQDVAVVPLLVALPILGAQGAAGAAGAVWTALAIAGLKAAAALGFAEVAFKRILDGLFYFAAKSRSQEAFLSVVLLTVLGMSALTESLGLSGALGAFLAGVSLSETRYRYQVEADVAPFRGILLGLFFVTAGFSLDLGLIASNPIAILGLASTLLVSKFLILFGLATLRGQTVSDALRVSLLLAPGGEFAFVALGSAARFGVLPLKSSELLQTTTALTMASTPLLNAVGTRLARRFGSTEVPLRKKNPVVVCGYGRVGRVVCELLDAKLVDYVAFDLDPTKATNARQKGKPVFFGDLGRPEVLDYFRVGDAKLVVVAVSDQKSINRVVVNLRRKYPALDIIARATDKDHQRRLNNVLGVVALVPAIPETSRLLSLPFAGAVLKCLRYDNVDVLVEESRRSALGLYSGQQSSALIDQEQEALLEQLGLLSIDSDDDSLGSQSDEEENVVSPSSS